MNEKLFYDSKGRMVGLSILTITLSIAFGFAAISMLTGGMEMEPLMFILLIGITLILLPTSFFLMKKVKNNEPSVIVNEKGITINGYIPKIGFIPWEDIEGCLPYSLQGQLLLGFVLYDEEKYLNKFTGMNRKILEANKGMGFPAVNIAIKNLKDREGFLNSLEENKVAFFIPEK